MVIILIRTMGFLENYSSIFHFNVSMTTPVEADINPGRMRFFVGIKDARKKTIIE